MSLPSHIGCVYLHGFLSSPQSTKAQQLLHYFDDHNMATQLRVPCLGFEPAIAIQQAEEAIIELQAQAGIEQVFLIGSSLGGYYATHLANKLGIKAVLVNPAVKPYDLFDKYLGPNEHFYDGKTYQLEMKHIQQLQQLEVDTLVKPENLLLLLQTADETLDYALACEKYLHCPSWIEAGGNHSFEGFMQRLPMIFNFI
jgi:predicted esterase YcpF (UPF0227 family)